MTLSHLIWERCAQVLPSSLFALWIFWGRLFLYWFYIVALSTFLCFIFLECAFKNHEQWVYVWCYFIMCIFYNQGCGVVSTFICWCKFPSSNAHTLAGAEYASSQGFVWVCCIDVSCAHACVIGYTVKICIHHLVKQPKLTCSITVVGQTGYAIKVAAVYSTPDTWLDRLKCVCKARMLLDKDTRYF